MRTDVEFAGYGGTTLRGWWYVPEGDGPFPAVVWTHGSGRVTRTDPIYRSLAFWFVERGIAEPLELVILYKSGFAASLDVFVTRNAENNAFGLG